MLRSVDVEARLKGTREEHGAILTDFGNYRGWVPGIEVSSILACEGDVTIVEFQGRRFSERPFNLELVCSPPDLISFRQIDSLDRPEISGQLRLGETETGIGSPSVLIRLSARVETPLFGLGRRGRIRSALRAGLDALGAQHGRQISAQPIAEDRKQKVLEVVREAAGLRVWYLGESFLMPRQDSRS